MATSLLRDVAALVTETGFANAGSLQRRFRIPFSVAENTLDQLTAAGILGPAQGSLPRDVLMTPQQAQRALRGQ